MKRLSAWVIAVGILYFQNLPEVLPTRMPLPATRIAETKTEAIFKELQPKINHAPTFSKKFIFSIIRKKLQSDRSRIAFCLLTHKDFSATQIKMTLLWYSSGLLQEITFNPDPGETVVHCIHEIVSEWDLQAHPGAQPFSYPVDLIPSGI